MYTIHIHSSIALLKFYYTSYIEFVCETGSMVDKSSMNVLRSGAPMGRGWSWDVLGLHVCSCGDAPRINSGKYARASRIMVFVYTTLTHLQMKVVG